MRDEDFLERILVKEVAINTLYGEGSFMVGSRTVQSSFILTCTASSAYCSFYLSYDFVTDLTNIRLTGNLDDGRTCKAILYGDYSIQDGNTVINCQELTIGNEENIQTIDAELLGIYFPHEFSFGYKKYDIKFTKPKNPREVAKRTKRITGAILEGNSIVISGDNLDVEDINDLIGDICPLLRPLTSSEVYFGLMKCNQRMIIYHKKRMMGRLLGMRSNILESTHQYPDYLKKGLEKLETIDDFDRISIVDIGHSLSTSSACGLMETGLMVLVSS